MSAPSGSRRRTRAPGRAFALLLGVIFLAGPTGCGQRSARNSALTFEDLPDTAGLSHGAPILTSFEPYRITGQAIRVRGTAQLPDGTRLQVSIVRVATGETVMIAQVSVEDHAFETGPLVGPRGPFPLDLYRFDVLAHFNPVWQPGSVMRATHDGRSLRGPGITRSRGGQPTFFLREECRL